LEYAHRIVRAEHAYRAREADLIGAFRGGREHDRGGRHGEVRPVMLANAEDVEPDLIGQLNFF
jgi:hypothetical protein